MDYSPPASSVPGDSPGRNTGVGCHALLQGIFPTQGSNPGIPLAGGFCTVWAAREAYIHIGCVGLQLCWVFIAAQFFSSCGKQGLLSSCGVWAFYCGGVSCCRADPRAQGLHLFWFPGPRAQAQKLWWTGLVVLWHVGSSRTRDQTCVSCIGKRILYHWATREAQTHFTRPVLP